MEVAYHVQKASNRVGFNLIVSLEDRKKHQTVVAKVASHELGYLLFLVRTHLHFSCCYPQFLDVAQKVFGQDIRSYAHFPVIFD